MASYTHEEGQEGERRYDRTKPALLSEHDGKHFQCQEKEAVDKGRIDGYAGQHRVSEEHAFVLTCQRSANEYKRINYDGNLP